MRRTLVVLAVVASTFAAVPHADAVPTCGGRPATLVLGDGDDDVAAPPATTWSSSAPATTGTPTGAATTSCAAARAAT